MGAVKDAFDNIGNGIKHTFEGIGHAVDSLVKLDFNGVGDGFKEVGEGLMDLGKGITRLSPATLAVNALTDGAFNKVQDWCYGQAKAALDGTIDECVGLEKGLEKFADGAARGDWDGALQGFGDVVKNGGLLALNFVPGVGPEASLALKVTENAVRTGAEFGLNAIPSST